MSEPVKCPHCQKIFFKIDDICPFCKKDINDLSNIVPDFINDIFGGFEK